MIQIATVRTVIFLVSQIWKITQMSQLCHKCRWQREEKTWAWVKGSWSAWPELSSGKPRSDCHFQHYQGAVVFFVKIKTRVQSSQTRSLFLQSLKPDDIAHRCLFSTKPRLQSISRPTTSCKPPSGMSSHCYFILIIINYWLKSTAFTNVLAFPVKITRRDFSPTWPPSTSISIDQLKEKILPWSTGRSSPTVRCWRSPTGWTRSWTATGWRSNPKSCSC